MNGQDWMNKPDAMNCNMLWAFSEFLAVFQDAEKYIFNLEYVFRGFQTGRLNNDGANSFFL